MKTKLLLIFALFAFGMLQAQDVWTTYDTTNSNLTFDIISDIEFDSQGNKWVASWFNTGGKGIAKFDDTTWTIYNTENIQASNDIHIIEFTTDSLEAWVSVSATTTVYFANGSQTIITSEQIIPTII